jgi:hypothetical protein
MLQSITRWYTYIMSSDTRNITIMKTYTVMCGKIAWLGVLIICVFQLMRLWQSNEIKCDGRVVTFYVAIGFKNVQLLFFRLAKCRTK